MLPVERCELCALPLADAHPHLWSRERRSIVCACDACATLFGLTDAGDYRRIRPLVRRLPVALDDAAWKALGVPVGLAFLTLLPDGAVVAAYPGPAGAAVATVDPAAWAALVTAAPALASLEPEIEAWLVNRLGPEPRTYRVSIDHCFRLAGVVRTRWRGVGGGPEVASTITDFFQRLDEQAA